MGEREERLLQAYRAGAVTRRDFIAEALAIAGSLTAAAPLLEAAGIATAQAEQVDPNAPDLASEMVQYPGPAGAVSAYQSRPKAPGRQPAVVVIHENRGLTPYIQDVARRLARAGYHALAPDLLSRRGGTGVHATSQAAIEAIRGLSNADVQADLRAALAWLQKADGVRGDRLGVVGFCWGGAQSLLLGTASRDLDAVVVFYGRNPSPLDLVQNLTAPLLAIYGEDDPAIIPGVAPLEAALKQAGKVYEIKVYPGAKHAFHNDTNPERYHAEAARDAWQRTLAFYRRHLQG
jgi:carboxymethylenebutenolidase